MQESPFFLLYGRDVVLPTDVAFGVDVNETQISHDEDKIQYKQQLIASLKVAYENLIQRRDEQCSKYKFYYDKFHQDIRYQPGEKVMLYWPVPKRGLSYKLLPKWDGPYTITKQLGNVTYRIEKEGRSLAVHVQRLRRFTPRV